MKKRIGWKEMEINAYDVAGDEIKNVLDEIHAAKTITEVVSSLRGSKVMSALLNSEIFIFIVDSLACDPTVSRVSEEKKAEHDSFLATLWLAIQEYKKKTKWNVKGLALLFAKYDLGQFFLPLGNADYYSVAAPNQPMQKGSKSQSEGAQFQDILVQFLPYTYNNLQYAFKSIDPQNLKYFKSGITMATKENQEPDAGPIALPLTFTANEFVNIIKWLAEI
jgi:hypothetical protein